MTVSANMLVINEIGLHARPAADFVKGIAGLNAEIKIRNTTKNSDWHNAKSIIDVLSLGIENGHEIEITCSGEDENNVLKTLKDQFTSFFRFCGDNGHGPALADV